jgi:hypothetical protein
MKGAAGARGAPRPFFFCGFDSVHPMALCVLRFCKFVLACGFANVCALIAVSRALLLRT